MHFFLSLCPHQRGGGGGWSQLFLLETVETGDKNCDVAANI